MITLIEPLLKIAILIAGLMTAAAYFVLLERRMAAWIQDRRGPNRVGVPLSLIHHGLKDLRLFGLGQPLADGLKFIMKEEYVPGHVDRRLYVLAPITILAAALAVFAVIPFGSVTPSVAGSRQIELVVAPGFNVGMLYVFALSSIAVYGVILGGWASNNKYSFLGGLRSSAQLIAYELPLGLGILGVVLAAGSLNLERIIVQQSSTGIWFAFAQPLGLMVFVVAAFAEAARLPFDLPECEQELVGGYHTEYSGIKLLLFLVAEFLHMITASFLIVILFFGGWHFWGITGSAAAIDAWGSESAALHWLQAILRVVVLMGKICIVILFFMLVRWSWPRFRFDQLMALAWKVMLPLGLINLVAIAIFNEVRFTFDPQGGSKYLQLGLILASWIVCIGAWLLISAFGPLVADNRPRQDLIRSEL